MWPKGLSKTTLTKLNRLGIRVGFDLVLHLPLRYENETRLQTFDELNPSISSLVEGTVIHSEVVFRPRRSLVCQLSDENGKVVYLRFLSFYPSQQQQLTVGKRIRAFGEVRQGYFGLEMVHPKCLTVDENTPLAQGLTPIYQTTGGLSQNLLRKNINRVMDELDLKDTLPAELMGRLGRPSFHKCVHLLHNPLPEVNQQALIERTHPAWQRIKLDELLAQQLSMRIHYRKRRSKNAPMLPSRNNYTEQLLSALPFSLTKAQRLVFSDISRDIGLPHPMQRLLQGDVGSGKTIVAALAALQAIENGYQVALMSPTEILAEQHYIKLNEWLAPLGIMPVWLSGSLKKKEKEVTCQRISAGETMLAIGTHALFQDKVEFKQLGLVIVDEQHKFGVQQRLALRGKGEEPHQLMMSATPIPRTLAMSYYADLDVSVINELPPGRTPIVTKLVSDARREEVFERVRQACLSGRQAYWVCPLIDESETLDLQTAIETHQMLSDAFPELRIGLVHGKLDNAKKAQVMAEFKAGKIQLLVATTVIEVGVDVPNASLMVIDHAERMGLAQLHQLRGRVGRGVAQSMCVLLFKQPLSEMARARLKVIYENTDGFEIARQDLQLRGPGELLGARQSGVPMLRFADVEKDAELLETARALADELLRDYPDAAQAHLQRWMADRHDYLHV
ncbi:MAG: ATP-dependent DNA helicase RecG [Nitrosomonadales bacterium]|nr:ATP-dependent DNA helicase RecG [Nitrosomonadales bacterium]